jgi:hypothetical protein
MTGLAMTHPYLSTLPLCVALLFHLTCTTACSRSDQLASADAGEGRQADERSRIEAGAGEGADDPSEGDRSQDGPSSDDARNDDAPSSADPTTDGGAEDDALADDPNDDALADDPNDDGVRDADSGDDAARDGGDNATIGDAGSPGVIRGDDAGSRGATGDAASIGDAEAAAEGPVVPVPSCAGTTDLRSGATFGEYIVLAIRVAGDLAAGAYAVMVDGERAGLGHLFRDGERFGEFEFDASASLAGADEQTIVVPGVMEIDLRSDTLPDLTGLGDSIFDGCHLLVVEPRLSLSAGLAYGPFVLEELTVGAELPSGTYTFYTSTGNTGSVDLLRDGEVYDSLEYEWRTTIGSGASFTFDFSGVLQLTVTRAIGTSNLFGMADNIFNGRYEVVVP